MRLFAAALLVSLATGAERPYGHAWLWLQQPTQDELNACTVKLNQLLAEAPGIDQLPPMLLTSMPNVTVGFTGSDSREHAFLFPGAAYGNRIETSRRPYDVAVTAALITARDCFPKEVLEIQSDGAWPDDWLAGAQLYGKVFGHAAASPLERAPHGRWLWYAGGIALLLAVAWQLMKRR